MRNIRITFKPSNLMSMLVFIGMIGMLQGCASILKNPEALFNNPFDDDKISLVDTYQGTMKMITKASKTMENSAKHTQKALGALKKDNKRGKPNRIIRLELSLRAANLQRKIHSSKKSIKASLEKPINKSKKLYSEATKELEKLKNLKAEKEETDEEFKLPKGFKDALNSASENLIKGSVYQLAATQGLLAFPKKLLHFDAETEWESIKKTSCLDVKSMFAFRERVEQFMEAFDQIYSAGKDILEFAIEEGLITDKDVEDIEERAKKEVDDLVASLRS